MRLTVSATGQQEGQTDCWSLQQLYGVLSALWCYCDCNRAKGRAHSLFVTVVTVRCTVCTVDYTVSATGQHVRQTEFWSL